MTPDETPHEPPHETVHETPDETPDEAPLEAPDEAPRDPLLEPRPDPIAWFLAWLSQAERAGIADPNAMVVSTIDPAGWPSSRVVLLKQADDAGFVFYTNTRSQKGRDLDACARAALNFYWRPLMRQVRVRGAVTRVSDAEADAYFASRPRGSQVASCASEQGAPLASRDAMLAAITALEARYGDAPVPRPAHWSGYRVIPHEIELWQGRAFRVHDRFLYTRDDAGWRWTRLQP